MPLDPPRRESRAHSSALKYLLGGLIGAVASTLLIGANAYADETDDALAGRWRAQRADQPAVGRHRRSAGGLHAGRLRPRGDRVSAEAKNAAHVMSTNFAIFGLGFVGFLFIGFPLAFGGFSYPGYFGLNEPMNGTPLIGSGNWAFPVERLGSPRRRGDARPARLLPLHGGLHGHRGHDPHRLDGRAVEVEQLRVVGPVLRRHLLPAVRGLDLGRRLARQDVGHHGPRRRLCRLRRLRCGARRRWCRRPRRCHRARAPHRQVRPRRQGSGDPRPQHPDGHHSAASSCCSAGSASTPPPRSPAATSASPRWPPTRPSPAPSVPSSPCSG